MTVRVIDRGANALMQRLRQASGGLACKVGIMGDEAAAQHSDSELTMVEVATANEFGVGVPERSFIRAWADENERELKDRLRRIADSVVLRKMSVRPGLEQFGGLAVGDIQERISNGIEPPNSPQTKARKGSSTPLIDTGQLRSSITYLVEPGGPEGTV